MLDDSLIYTKTAAGELAMRERTRLIQRNLRMVLILVEGQTTVAALKAKVNDDALVESALFELEQMGLIEPQRLTKRKSRRTDGADGSNAVISVEDVTGPPVTDVEVPVSFEPADVLSQSAIPTQPPREYAPMFSHVAMDSPLTGAPSDGRVVRAEDIMSGTAPEQHAKNNGRQSWHLANLDVQDAFSKFRHGRLFRQADKEEEEFERAYREENPEPVKIKRIRKGPRSPLFWPLRIVLAVVGLLLALAAIAALFPFDRYRPQIEAAATRALHSPVKIESVHFTFTPYPNLTLDRLVVGGGAPYAWMERARLVPEPFSLLGDRTVVRSLEVESMRVSVAAVDRCAHWLAGAPEDFVLQNLKISNLGLDMGGTSIEGLSAEGSFKPQGGLAKLLLTSADRDFRVDAEPAGSIYRLSINASSWRLPLRPAITLSSLEATGELTGQQLRIPRFVAEFEDGLAEGGGTFDWSDGASLVGDVELKHVDMGKLSSTFDPDLAINGELSGRARIESRSKTAANLLDSMHFDGALSVSRVVLNHFDFVEAVRTPSRDPVRSGSTRVDQLDAKLNCDEKICRASGIRMASGLLRAEGRLAVTRAARKVDGSLSVELHGTANSVSAVVGIAGNFERPELLRH
jgi:hypothetical protein